MRTNLTHFVVAIMRGKLCIFAAAIALLPAVGRSQEYTITDLGTLGGTFSIATSVNNKGQVTGQSTTATQKQANGQADPFLYSNGHMIDLGNFGGSSGNTGPFNPIGNVANGVNDNGVVTGVAFTADGNPHPFLWNGGPLQDLAPGQTGAAFGINASNAAAGFTGFGNDLGGDLEGQGTVFNSVGNFEPVPIPPSLSIGSSVAINNAGQIVGNCSTDEDTVAYGCLATGNSAIILPPVSSSYSGTLAYAINTAGDTCGDSLNDFEDATATVWIGSTPVNLGRPPHTQASECKGMDNYGQYVGDANPYESNQVGVVYDTLHGARDLNQLVPRGPHGPIGPRGEHLVIQNAVALSDTGYIAADCVYSIDGMRACLLTPNLVVVLHDNVLTLTETLHECIPCQAKLASDARSLPKSLDGLTAGERERVVSTVDRIGEEIESLERDRKISAAKALLVLHDAELVLAAIDRRE